MGWVPFVVVPCVLLCNVAVHCCNENSWAWRRLFKKGRSLLTVTNRAAGVHQLQRPTSFWAWELADPADCVTSAVAPQWVLLALRLSALPYFAALFLVERFAYNTLGPTWLIHFTNWSFVAFALSMILGAAHIAEDLWRRWQLGKLRSPALLSDCQAAAGRAATPAPAPGDGQQVLLAAMDGEAPQAGHGAAAGQRGRQPESSGLLLPGTVTASRPAAACPSWSLLARWHLLAAEVAFPAELFLTGFYWAFLSGSSDGGLASNLMVHGINNLFCLADVALSRLPLVSYHFQALLLYGTAYLLFMWIYHGASGRWAYSVLDWSKASSVLYYLLLPLLLAAAFFLYFGLARLRERCLPQRRKQAAALQEQQQQQQQWQAGLPAVLAAKPGRSSVELQARPGSSVDQPLEPAV